MAGAVTGVATRSAAGESAGAVRRPLDARRWHFQHGPIDLVIEAFGPDAEIADARERGWQRFATVLEELVAELRLLRRPIEETTGVRGAVAKRMVAACLPYRGVFITPMAAVAGAVADEVLAAMMNGGRAIRKAYVNNGGDIALALAPGEAFRIGVIADCVGINRPLHDAEVSGAQLPLIQRGAELRGDGAADGITPVTVAGRSVELVDGCTEVYEFSALTAEVRRLVELERVDAIVAATSGPDEIVLRDLARRYPEVVFLPSAVQEGYATSGEEEAPGQLVPDEARAPDHEDVHEARSRERPATSASRANRTRVRASSTVVPSAVRWPIFRPTRGSALP